ncbi:MAG: molecular chaperone DnaJ [Streptococcaceae bacterium]|jgi:molecular chaperone DnaJ|nr:molecular chaperone DnaJ [Streptococcaceae bacterium]
MNNEEYYKELGVNKDASQDEIKKAYRKLSKQYHPDLNKDSGAEDKYKKVQEAYETLGDSEKRANYDQFGAAGANAGAGFEGQGGFSGFGGGFGGFEDIFSSFFGGGAQANPNAPQQGDDLQYRVNLTFEEAIFGAEKELKYSREDNCKTCSGSGAKAGTHAETCTKCHGRGVVNVVANTPLGRMQTQQTCDVCHGRGKIIASPCETCHGSGHQKQAHTVKVKVPAGVETGQQMRLQGQGEAGTNGGPFGDLYVRFQVEASKIFERDGSEIYYQMPINFIQAAMGDEVEVPTVHGNVKLKIPAGTQTGTNFRLKGKGAPRLRGSGLGDQHVVVNLEVPKSLNEAQKKALDEFAAASGVNVNKQKKGLFR